jgi:hypothetical protein
MHEAMNAALQRHEDDVRKVHELRLLQEQDFFNQMEVQKDVSRLEREEKELSKIRLQEELRQQVRDNEKKRQKQLKEDKEPKLTNGGPTVTDDQAKFLAEKQKK